MYKVRKGSLSDAIEIFDLVNDAYSIEEGCTGIAFKSMSRYRNLALVKNDLSAHPLTHEYVVVYDEQEDQIVGVCFAYLKKSAADITVQEPCHRIRCEGAMSGERRLGFGPLAVSPSKQRKGVSAKIMGRLLDLALLWDCSMFEIETVNHRTDLDEYYQRLGFREAGSFPFDGPPESLTRPCHFILLTKCVEPRILRRLDESCANSDIISLMFSFQRDGRFADPLHFFIFREIIERGWGKSPEIFQMMQCARLAPCDRALLDTFRHGYGYGVPQDRELASKIILSAPIDPSGRCHYMMYKALRRWQPVPNYKEAFRVAEEGAMLGCPISRNALGFCYLNGNGVEKDETKAVECFRIAFEAGEYVGASNLGLCYTEGFGVKCDDIMGTKYYKLSCYVGELASVARVEELREKDPLSLIPLGCWEPVADVHRWVPDNIHYQQRCLLLIKSRLFRNVPNGIILIILEYICSQPLF